MADIKVLLWDIDGTLLDFLAAEKCAIRACFAKFHMGECTDEMIARYSLMNRVYWERLERGEISKPQVLVGRFRDFFTEEGLDASLADVFNEEYQIRLGDTVVFCDDGDVLVRELSGKFRQFAVTNGTRVAQKRKLANSGLDQILEKAFISDEVGFEKPSAEFFDAVLSELSEYKRDELLIIGDSLTSDIRGGNNAGIPTCWYNPKQLANTQGVHVDYEIQSLGELRTILLKEEE